MPNQTKTLSGISLIALLLALTACGDDDTEAADQNGDDTTAEENGDSTDAEEIFDFTTGFHEPVTGPYEEVLIEIPSDLLQSDDAYREDRVLDAAIVRAGEHDDAQCAVEVDLLFADGVQDQIESLDWRDGRSMIEEGELVAEEARYNLLTGIAGEPENSSFLNNGFDRDVEYADDFTSAVVPLDCAADTADSSDVLTIEFRRVGEWRDASSEEKDLGEEEGGKSQEVFSTGGPRDNDVFAEADINVDSEGQLHIVRSHINGWQLDANENWITE